MERISIGILGGTFDPIHKGHLKLARTAYEQFALSKVLFVPSGISYMKRGVTDAVHRCKMVQLAIEEYPYFEYCDIDVIREGNTYTADSLEEIKELYKNANLYYIIGADSLFSIEKWKNPEKIMNLAHILVAYRQGEKEYVEFQNQIKRIETLYHGTVSLIDMTPVSISSTSIKTAMDHDESLVETLDTKVLTYIKQQHLYE